MKVLVFALCVGAIAALPAGPLTNGSRCGPEQWEGIVLTSNGYKDSTGKGGSSETGTYFAYDFTNKREVSYSNTTLDNGDVSMTFDFKFYNKGMQLTGDTEKRTCTVKKISEDMEKPCLSADDEILGQWESGDNTVVGLKFSRRNISITNFADLKTGLPVSQTMTDLAGNFFLVQMFLNTSLGINEEDVFDIPEYCDQPMEQFNLENECSPEQYQTTMLTQTGYSTDAGVSGVVESIASYYYDYTNKRDASYSNTTDSNNGQSMTLTIKDYANGKVYSADLAKGTCEINDLTSQMMPPCLPPGSKFLGMWTSGSNSVAAIRMHYPGGVAMFFSDTKKSLPLSVVMKGRNEEEKSHYLTAEMFVDTHVGIKDTDAFTPPSYCKPVDTSSVVG